MCGLVSIGKEERNGGPKGGTTEESKKVFDRRRWTGNLWLKGV